MTCRVCQSARPVSSTAHTRSMTPTDSTPACPGSLVGRRSRAGRWRQQHRRRRGASSCAERARRGPLSAMAHTSLTSTCHSGRAFRSTACLLGRFRVEDQSPQPVELLRSQRRRGRHDFAHVLPGGAVIARGAGQSSRSRGRVIPSRRAPFDDCAGGMTAVVAGVGHPHDDDQALLPELLPDRVRTRPTVLPVGVRCRLRTARTISSTTASKLAAQNFRSGSSSSFGHGRGGVTAPAVGSADPCPNSCPPLPAAEAVGTDPCPNPCPPPPPAAAMAVRTLARTLARRPRARGGCGGRWSLARPRPPVARSRALRRACWTTVGRHVRPGAAVLNDAVRWGGCERLAWSSPPTGQALGEQVVQRPPHRTAPR